VTQSIDVLLPDMGNFAEVGVIDVLVKPGDRVEIDTPLVTLETEKATMDVPSTAAGIVESVHVVTGGKISAGGRVVTLRAEGAAVAAPAASAPVAAVAVEAAASATAPAAAPVSVGVTVPDMGNFAEVGVVELLVAVGDTVEIDTPLVTLETEKATMDVPSTVAGVVEQLHVAKGGKISAGGLVVTVRSTATPVAAVAQVAAAVAAPAPAAPAPVQAPAAAKPAAPAAPAALPPIGEAGFSKAHAGPSVRKLARELGVDLGRVKGSGPRSRITHEDVKGWVKQALATGGGAAGGSLPAVPQVDFAAFGPIELKPLNRVQKISGPRLHASWVNLPHVTQFDEADITDLEVTRNRLKDAAAAKGIKLTPLAFIIRACVQALQQYPQFNASLDASGENIVLKKYMHIGFAADTPNGLLVPVIRDADKKDIYQIAKELAELSAKARDGKLTGAQMQGGCFTVSSLGGIGGTAFTPIINAPEAAILGVSRTQTKPVWKDGAFVPRQMLPLSLSYDHRIIDGAAGARFSTALAQVLANPGILTEAIP
jgi:pyruvate dehydrogenase E2 component (dihydrolipoamide acetyltransferase)